MSRAGAVLAATAPHRVAWIDQARGVALLLMIVYHFSFDLSMFGLVSWQTATGAWRLFAVLIASSFITLSGLSLGLAHLGGIRWRAFARRLVLLLAAALAVTLGSGAAMPVPITFGILHAIALFSVLALPFLFVSDAVLALTAAFVFAVPRVWKSEAFSHPLLVPIGLDPTPPRMLDYEPLFPWFSAMLAGLLLARHVPVPRRDAATDLLARMGRHSLAIYLIHQPVLIGLLYAAVFVFAGLL